MAEARQSWVDAVKGLTISLVVLHHVYAGVQADMPIPAALPALSLVLFTLRMPLFFCIAGLFAIKAIQGPWRGIVESKVLHFAYLYLIWGVISVLCRYYLSSFAHHQVSPMSLFSLAWNPPLTLWFIYVLTLSFVIARATRGIAPALQIALAMACSAYVVANFDDRGQIVLRLLRYYPFFLIGTYASAWIQRSAAHASWTGFAGFAVAFVALAAVALRDKLFMVPPVYYAMALCGCGAVIALIHLNQTHAPARLLAGIGRRSLYVYLTHFLPAAGFRILLQKLGIHDPVAIILIAWPLAVASCLLFYEMARRTPLRFLYERPALLHYRPVLVSVESGVRT
jgi:uncharacterized membrane protein YcfT